MPTQGNGPGALGVDRDLLHLLHGAAALGVVVLDDNAPPRRIGPGGPTPLSARAAEVSAAAAAGRSADVLIADVRTTAGDLRLLVPLTADAAAHFPPPVGVPSAPLLPAAQAEATLALVRASAEALCRGDRMADELDTIADELGHSYEILTFLYRVGHKMIDVRRPNEFVRAGISGLAELLGFRWAGLVRTDRGDAASDAETLIAVGEKVERDCVAAELAGLASGRVTPMRDVRTPQFEVLGDELLVQSVTAGNAELARLVFGGKDPEVARSPDITSADTQAAEALSTSIGSVLQAAILYEEQEAMLLGSLKALSKSLDAKDRYTRGHSERVALLARMIALEAGLRDDFAERAGLAGRLHDIGKIGVPDRVLCKPGRLTDEEFELIRRHPTLGRDILADIPAVADILPGVLHHHERWDGRGYPAGLAGAEIPEIARVLAIADTFDAMSSNRAYRGARRRDEVLAEIGRSAGTQLDPTLTDAFLRIDLAPFDEMIARHAAERSTDQRVERAA